MTLDQIALSHGTDKASSHHNYCVTYEKYFEPFRNDKIHCLEIGTQFGYSIKTWLEYFPNAHVAGIDVANDFKCDDPRYVFAQADQADHSFWKKFNPFLAEWKIVWDDGPHCLPHQSISLDHLWPNMASGSYYCIEDTYVWPDPLWKQQSQASSFLTQLVWWLNKSGKQYYGRPGGVSEPLNAMESSIDFIHMYPGLIIIKKK